MTSNSLAYWYRLGGLIVLVTRAWNYGGVRLGHDALGLGQAKEGLYGDLRKDWCL